MVRESNQLNFNLPKKILLTQNKEDTHGVSDTDMNSRCPWLLMRLNFFDNSIVTNTVRGMGDLNPEYIR